MGIVFIALVFIVVIFLLMKTIIVAAKEMKKNTCLVDYASERIPEGCKSLNDILLKVEGEIIKVEKVLISKKGIFVIITKDYEGWIFGKEKEKYWTQMIYNSKNKFLNPIMENEKYVEAIRKKLANIKKVPIYPIVLFKDECNLKKIESVVPVMNCWELRRYVLNLKVENVLSEEEIVKIMNNLGKKQKKENKYDMFVRKIWSK